MEERDVVIIGGGPAGYAAAIRLAQLGRKATLIEKETLGGTCLNRGCIPTMVLAKAVELLEAVKNGKDFGITFTDAAVDFTKLMARKSTVVKILVGGVRALVDAYGIELREGSAKFLSPFEIEVDGNDGLVRRLAAKKVIIATGSTAAKKDAQGGSDKTIDTRELLGLSAPPPSLVLLNGGFVGLTFATIFSHLGTKVTVIEESERLLPEIDAEIVDILQRELKKSKIRIITGARAARIENGADGEIDVEVEAKGERILVKAAFAVNGKREPNLDGLGLSVLGVELNERRGIATDAAMETSVKSIFAAGDVTMNHLWTPAAYMEGITAAENIAGSNSAIDYSTIPYWSSTIPPICGAGMTEEQARAQGYRVEVGRFPLAANGMATILGRRTGLAKVVTDARYGQILGVQVIGHHAPELVHEMLLAMKSELTAREIGSVFHTHPSLSEALWEAARVVDGTSIHSFSAKL